MCDMNVMIITSETKTDPECVLETPLHALQPTTFDTRINKSHKLYELLQI